MQRVDGRDIGDLRPVKITRSYIKHAEGSVLIEMGDTKVICNATVEEQVPGFKKNSGEGWVTAEYSMLPRATATRNPRDIGRLRQNPRSVEIQRLIGRALRAVVDFKALGERSITLDCDVIQADGGTRTAAITGAYVALVDACNTLVDKKLLSKIPLKGFVAAVSVGVVEENPMLDLCYTEDYRAKVDMNVVMTDAEEYIEIQGTGEEAPFSKEQLEALLELAKKGTQELIEKQKEALGELSNRM